MPYTYTSLAFAWLIFLALFAMSASGAAGGWRLILLLAAAFLVPAIVLRTRTDAAATSPGRPLIVADGREQSRFDLRGIDVLNEGDPNRRDTQLPGIVTAWRQRRNLELDVDEQVPRAPWNRAV